MFDLDAPLLNFNGIEPFSIRQACEGVVVFGGIGSGKTSGSGQHLARAYLDAGFGGLVLCAKKDERETWEQYARETGRSDSLMVFDARGSYRFNFLQYEMKRGGAGAGYTDNMLRLFITVNEAIERSKSGGGSDPYWDRALQQIMRNAIDLCSLSRGEVSIPLLYDVVMSAPRSPEERSGADWRKESTCWKLLTEANQRELDQWASYDLESTASYWLEEFPGLAPRTRSGIVSMFTSMVDNFLRRPFRQLFCSDITIVPDLSHNGAVIVLDLPVKEFGEAGRAAQVMFKYIWQQAVERRDAKTNPRPCFLWIDEAQNFVTDYDMQFQATARSSRACTVYLSQNLPNFYAEMGGENSRSRVDSLIGNLQTKIWHANSDPQTNTFAADTIGKSWQLRRSDSSSFGQGVNIGESAQESYDYDLIPQAFSILKKGGPLNDFEVQGIVFQNGRVWNNGRTFLPVTFNQKTQ